MMEMHKSILDIYRPKLVPLEHNLTAAVFPFMKIFPAEFCVRRAREEGWISSQSLVVETSSGNMALGLAIVCNLYGYKLSLVSDYACDGFLRRRIEDLGARLDIVSAPSVAGGYQKARLDRLMEIREQVPDHWWVSQYDNPCNAGAYAFFAAQLIEGLGRVDCLVGTVGSGGSVCGTSVFLKELFPEMKVVGVDTFGSVLFGQPDSVRKLRGLGNSIIPRNLEHTVFDEVHWVSAAEAYKATRMLHQGTSLFCGGTSGAAWMVARYWAQHHPRARVACIFPDDGYRYAETIYSDDYLCKENLWLKELPTAPLVVTHPLEANATWSCMRWERRKLSELAAAPVSVDLPRRFSMANS
jgi:S-sulfo-L-cysteine synthase (3-phospho-L-serine-dependent)